MWFYAELNRNPDLFIEIFSEEDVQVIAKTIRKEKHQYACSRISYELALSGIPKDAEDMSAPIILEAFDVFNETYLKNKKGSKLHIDLTNVLKNIDDLHQLLGKKDIHDLIVAMEEVSETDIIKFNQMGISIKNSVSNLTFDIHRRRKNTNIAWGSLGRYKVFIAKCAEFYFELTGEAFTADFNRENKNCKPITDGAYFAYKFHLLLNRFGEHYNCKIFTDKNFATACEEIPKAQKLKIKNLKNNH